MSEPKGKATARLEWLRKRTTGIGSSDSPVLVLGDVFGKGPIDTYLSKVTEPTDDGGDNPNFRRGNTYEPLALALYQDRTGMKVFAPTTDTERFVHFHLRDPKLSHIYGDLDGLAADGWVLEVKSPMQRVCDRIRSEGLKDYYQIQGQHLVRVVTRCAAAGQALPGLGKMPEGWKCPGVRFIIYEPEKCDLIIVEVPTDDIMGEAIYDAADRFWRENVVARNPPIRRTTWQQPVKVKTKSKGGEYTEVEGPAWDEAVSAFIVARESERAAKARVARAKETIEAAMRAGAKPKVRTAAGWKFTRSETAGRKGFDLKLLTADHPELDFKRYETQGKPYTTLRSYGPNDATSDDDSMEGQLGTLQDELAAFVAADHEGLDIEQIAGAFDDLRNRTELYSRMLRAEAEWFQNELMQVGEKFQHDVSASSRATS